MPLRRRSNYQFHRWAPPNTTSPLFSERGILLRRDKTSRSEVERFDPGATIYTFARAFAGATAGALIGTSRNRDARTFAGATGKYTARSFLQDIECTFYRTAVAGTFYRTAVAGTII